MKIEQSALSTQPLEAIAVSTADSSHALAASGSERQGIKLSLAG